MAGLRRRARVRSRYARRHLRGASPALPPAREPCNRRLRRHGDAPMACFLDLGRRLRVRHAPAAALATAAVPTRSAERRGGGRRPGLADIPGLDPGTRSNRLGWFEGVRLLLAVTPAGAITGFALGPGGAKDPPRAATSVALRRRPQPRAGAGGGAPAAGPDVTATGVAGRDHHRRWAQEDGAAVLGPPTRTSAPPWPRAAWRRWRAGHRQIVATALAGLLSAFRLDRERPHGLDGLQARLAAKVTLHNSCIWFDEQRGRPRLAFADRVDW